MVFTVKSDFLCLIVFHSDTDEGGTSDVDSVRTIPSKSETGSPPNRQGTNGRKQAQRLLNGKI